MDLLGFRVANVQLILIQLSPSYTLLLIYFLILHVLRKQRTASMYDFFSSINDQIRFI